MTQPFCQPPIIGDTCKDTLNNVSDVLTMLTHLIDSRIALHGNGLINALPSAGTYRGLQLIYRTLNNAIQYEVKCSSI